MGYQYRYERGGMRWGKKGGRAMVARPPRVWRFIIYAFVSVKKLDRPPQIIIKYCGRY